MIFNLIWRHDAIQSLVWCWVWWHSKSRSKLVPSVTTAGFVHQSLPVRSSLCCHLWFCLHTNTQYSPVLTWSPSVGFPFSQQFSPHPPKTFISPISHPPWNSISLKLRNYSKKYFSVIFMGWGLEQKPHCSRHSWDAWEWNYWQTRSFILQQMRQRDILTPQTSKFSSSFFIKNLIKSYRLKVSVSSEQAVTGFIFHP